MFALASRSILIPGKEKENKKLRERFLFERTESDKTTERYQWKEKETRESDYESLRREGGKRQREEKRSYYDN